MSQVTRGEYVENAVQFALVWRTQTSRGQRRKYTKGELDTLMDHAAEMILQLSQIIVDQAEITRLEAKWTS